MPQKKYTDVETYIADFSGESRVRIYQLRSIILSLIPNATERISYNIPAYFVGKTMVVYFAGYENHVSLYPLHLISAEKQSLFKAYASGKATFKIPHKQPFPVELVEQFVKLRVELIER